MTPENLVKTNFFPEIIRTFCGLNQGTTSFVKWLGGMAIVHPLSANRGGRNHKLIKMAVDTAETEDLSSLEGHCLRAVRADGGHSITCGFLTVQTSHET